MRDVHRTEGADGPHDPMTRMADAALEAVRAIDPTVRIIVIVDNEQRGGLAMGGFAEDAEAVACLLIHTRALLQTSGHSMTILPAPIRGEG